MIKFWIPKHIREARSRERNQAPDERGGQHSIMPKCAAEKIEESVCLAFGLFIIMGLFLLAMPLSVVAEIWSRNAHKFFRK